jgi:glycosyltransferase involved in cell wall biosynthesis
MKQSEMIDTPGTFAISDLTCAKTTLECCVDLREIGVVIPAYNAETTIAGIIGELIRFGFEKDSIIVVNDGSTDRTGETVKIHGVTLVNHEKNMGKGAAMRDGFGAAAEMHLKKVIIIDADAQHQVSEAAEFLKLNGRYDIVIGERTDVLSIMPLDRMLTNRTVNLVVSLLCGVRTTDVQCGFRYVDLKIFDEVSLATNNYQTESEMVIKAARRGYKVGFVPITTIYGKQKSYINPLVDTIRFINMAVRSLWR